VVYATHLYKFAGSSCKHAKKISDFSGPGDWITRWYGYGDTENMVVWAYA